VDILKTLVSIERLFCGTESNFKEYTIGLTEKTVLRVWKCNESTLGKSKAHKKPILSRLFRVSIESLNITLHDIDI
jgi:hypothetical protein